MCSKMLCSAFAHIILIQHVFPVTHNFLIFLNLYLYVVYIDLYVSGVVCFCVKMSNLCGYKRCDPVNEFCEPLPMKCSSCESRCRYYNSCQDVCPSKCVLRNLLILMISIMFMSWLSFFFCFWRVWGAFLISVIRYP